MALTRAQIDEIQQRLDEGMTPEAIADSIGRLADLDELDIVGMYPNYAEAYKAWKAVAQRMVDNAQMRYFIVHLHRLLDPNATAPPRL